MPTNSKGKVVKIGNKPAMETEGV